MKKDTQSIKPNQDIDNNKKNNKGLTNEGKKEPQPLITENELKRQKGN